MGHLASRFLPYVALPPLSAWMISIRARWCGLENVEEARNRSGTAIFCFWHEDLPYLCWSHRGHNARVLVSRHGDGEFVARMLSVLGFQLVRGSTTRGGTTALRQMAREKNNDLGVTPDGPRGPRRTVQLGVIQLAMLTGLPIVPISLAFQHCKRLRSWDRMALPRPFSRAVGIFHEPLFVARSSREELQQRSRGELERIMRAGSEETVARFDSLYRQGASNRRLRSRYFFTRETSSM